MKKIVLAMCVFSGEACAMEREQEWDVSWMREHIPCVQQQRKIDDRPAHEIICAPLGFALKSHTYQVLAYPHRVTVACVVPSLDGSPLNCSMQSIVIDPIRVSYDPGYEILLITTENGVYEYRLDERSGQFVRLRFVYPDGAVMVGQYSCREMMGEDPLCSCAVDSSIKLYGYSDGRLRMECWSDVADAERKKISECEMKDLFCDLCDGSAFIIGIRQEVGGIIVVRNMLGGERTVRLVDQHLERISPVAH